MLLFEKFYQLKPQQKWIAIGIAVIAGFFMLGLITFWIAFNAILHRVDTEQQTIHKKQLEIKAQADKMQAQMNEQAKSFQTDAQQTVSNMSNMADSIANNAIKAASRQLPSMDFDSKINAEIMEDSLLSSEEDEIQNEVSFCKECNYSKTLKLAPDEKQIIKKIIADYRQKNPELIQKYDVPTLLKLSPQDKIALLEIIRVYNKKQLSRDEEIAGKPWREMSKEVRQGFIESINDQNKSFKKGLNEWQKNLDEISKGFNNTDKPTSASP